MPTLPLQGVPCSKTFSRWCQSPARYINTEINAVHKDLAKVTTKVCLFFPDTYEVGMSHLGLRILYHILNSRRGHGLRTRFFALDGL